MRIGIAGAGLMGRLLAWHLARDGHTVEVFDAMAGPQPAFDGHGAAAFSAAGMLSPTAELDGGEPRIAELGWRSIAHWATITAALRVSTFSQRGSLLVAHRHDLPSAYRVLARIGAQPPARAPQPLHAQALRALEPALAGVTHAWLLPGEGHIEPVATMQALHERAEGVRWHWQRPVAAVAPGRLYLADGGERRFDWAVDTRGLGARPQLSVRGVRGETVWLQLPAHGLTRPVRLLHPRYFVYLVPRNGDELLLGASSIESEDRSPVSLRSAVELMAAAYSAMPALAEARILQLDRNLRPALPDNLPHLECVPGLLRINGLYRHGWLVAPALAEEALARLAAVMETA
ncbi:MAG: FAD-dependent oxidoreductase [Burkholderiaceae bacterium]|nr:FAD-dependent oxidoreductase [Burkholderiaceae bacterium]